VLDLDQDGLVLTGRRSQRHPAAHGGADLRHHALDANRLPFEFGGTIDQAGDRRGLLERDAATKRVICQPNARKQRNQGCRHDMNHSHGQPPCC
jgi:hypothetical protein